MNTFYFLFLKKKEKKKSGLSYHNKTAKYISREEDERIEKAAEAPAGLRVGSGLRVERLASKAGSLYANATVKPMRNRLLLICWKPQRECGGADGEAAHLSAQAAVTPSDASKTDAGSRATAAALAS